MKEKLRNLPSIDSLLKNSEIDSLLDDYTYEMVKATIQESLNEIRQALLNGIEQNIAEEAVLNAAKEKLFAISKPALQSVINATGTVLHTNLGRALLSDKATEAIIKVAKDYNNLEYNLEAGQRGTRYEHLESIIQELTGAEAALVVNNNAAAVTLYLTALTQGKEVIISRGELVEIGGSFRIPDVIASGGAILREVGSTNKTHLSDYEAAINEETGALIRVHTSNYRLVGFTESVNDAELVELAHSHGLPAFNDLGSGLLIDLQSLGLSYEPTVTEMLESGYDLVSSSGDKLLGGPQAGIIVGKAKYINVLKKHPLLRALRTDKVTIAALEATLRQYLKPEKAFAEIPTLRMIGTPLEVLKGNAELLAEKLKTISGIEVEVMTGTSQVGGGAYPGEYLPTALVSIKHSSITDALLEEKLRLSEPHVIGRIHNGYVQFDVRTILEDQYDVIVNVVREIIH